MKKYFSTLLSWVLFLLLASLMFWSVYRISLDPYAPIKNAEIPQETKDYFAGILGKFGFDIKFVDNLDDKNWSNDNDFGVDSISGLVQTEDNNFVVYFDISNPSEREKAGITLKFANENIKPLAKLFGKYFYPADVKGRKLPIYIANSEEKFNRVYSKLSGTASNTQWMAGVCINSVSSNGEILTDGIILKDYGPSGEKQRFMSNLKHEMAHYVHLNSVDWLSTHPLIWETEGFAMYFENNKTYLKSLGNNIRSSVNQIHLDQDVKNYLDAYWVGYSVLLCLSDKYNPDKVKEYIHSSYQLPTNTNFEKNIHITINSFEPKWKQYVREKF